jgi:protein transport protein SEC13
MATEIVTQHEDVIHDAQFDYYGQFLATASSDHTVRIFRVAEDKNELVSVLAAHEGPVWMVSWGHPTFGKPIATASYDHRIIIWNETAPSSCQWRPIYVIGVHHASVNAVQWAPFQNGAMIASASSDGTVAVTAMSTDGGWQEPVIVSDQHKLGATAVSFAPFHRCVSAVVLACGGCDNQVALWGAPLGTTAFKLIMQFKEHSDWIRDVAFSSNAESPFCVLASCSQDSTIVVRRKEWANVTTGGAWASSTTKVETAAWRLSWSPCGKKILATAEESRAQIFQEPPVFEEPWLICAA